MKTYTLHLNRADGSSEIYPAATPVEVEQTLLLLGAIFRGSEIPDWAYDLTENED